MLVEVKLSDQIIMLQLGECVVEEKAKARVVLGKVKDFLSLPNLTTMYMRRGFVDVLI